jgi:hypothetical protein
LVLLNKPCRDVGIENCLWSMRNEVKQGLNHISFRPMRLNEVVFVVLDAWKQIWDLLDL